jgi:hypothetical protein
LRPSHPAVGILDDLPFQRQSRLLAPCTLEGNVVDDSANVLVSAVVNAKRTEPFPRHFMADRAITALCLRVGNVVEQGSQFHDEQISTTFLKDYRSPRTRRFC